MISYSNLKSFSATCKLTLAHICGDESWECKALEQIYFDDTFRWKGNWYSSYLLTISSGSGIARCLASGPEFWYSSYGTWLLSSGSGIAIRCPQWLRSRVLDYFLLTVSIRLKLVPADSDGASNIRSNRVLETSILWSWLVLSSKGPIRCPSDSGVWLLSCISDRGPSVLSWG